MTPHAVATPCRRPEGESNSAVGLPKRDLPPSVDFLIGHFSFFRDTFSNHDSDVIAREILKMTAEIPYRRLVGGGGGGGSGGGGGALRDAAVEPPGSCGGRPLKLALALPVLSPPRSRC